MAAVELQQSLQEFIPIAGTSASQLENSAKAHAAAEASAQAKARVNSALDDSEPLESETEVMDTVKVPEADLQFTSDEMDAATAKADAATKDIKDEKERAEFLKKEVRLGLAKTLARKATSQSNVAIQNCKAKKQRSG